MERSGGVSGGRRDDLEDVGEGLASACPVEGCLQGSKTQAGSGVGGIRRPLEKGREDMWAVGFKGRMRRSLSSALHYEWELPTSSPPLKETLVNNQVAFEVSFGYPSGVSSDVTPRGA